MARVLTHVVPDGTASGIVAGLGDIKVVGILAFRAEKDFRLYSGTAATEANLVAQAGSDCKHAFMMFPENREVPCNGVYAAFDNAHGGIIYYI